MDARFAQVGSFHIVNLGCKVNRVEADTFAAALLARGSQLAEEEAADLIVVNTCTVTGEADKKARKAVRHAVAVNPLASIVVTGCAAAINPEVFSAIDPRVSVMGKLQLEQALVDRPGEGERLRTGEGFRTRVGLKVQDGCDHACTYCIVHVARGPARSVPAARAACEARRYFDAGIREVVLTGIDIGAYRDGDVRLPELVEMLLGEADEAFGAHAPSARIRISSIEPLSIDRKLVEILATGGGRVCRHLHVPLQSGRSRVLAEMGRPYSAERYLELVQGLRREMPGLSLSTDIIVGFPGETEADFESSCELARAAGFSRIHVFPYSMREGTPAARREDQVPAEVKRARAAVLRKLAAELSARDRAARRGTEELALVEGAMALTESYHEVEAPSTAIPGSLVRVKM